ncbi:MAG: hypothetical protein K2H90_02775 [Oscillospiraceae bacterium]|nr:hypothetical protein [Oscillospiraceae bacterium]
MKYNVNLRVETSSGVAIEPYYVTAGNRKSAESIAAAEAIRRHGHDNVIEISSVSVTEVSHAVA